MQVRTFKFRSNKERTYIGLTDVMDFFEPSILGGESKLQRAKQLATIQYGDCAASVDDIDSSKCIFRSRSKFIVTKFLDDNDVQTGDLLRIEKVAPFTYRITAVKKRVK